jgi:hypothetical protein
MNLAHDDDGIIDLRALKSTPPPRGAFPMASPFGSEPPPAAFARDADSGLADVVPVRASRVKTIGIAAGAALFLVLGAVGVVFAFRGEKPRAVASAPITQAAPPPVAVAPPPPVVDPAPAAAPQSAANADDASDAPPAKKTKGAKGRAGAAKAKASFVASSSPASAPKPAVTKAADPCHCHGDFQCNIRCSANR